MEQIDNIKHLPLILLARRCFKNGFDSRLGIAERIIQHQIHPRLLPLAVAHMEASHEFYDRVDRLKPSVTDKPIGTRRLVQTGSVHDIIQKFMDNYLSLAIKEVKRLQIEPKETGGEAEETDGQPEETDKQPEEINEEPRDSSWQPSSAEAVCSPHFIS
ncbi:hypothetical protein F5Y09DRAFT_353648 [Xylaria sp. FL1042]|nr:hypothetical protein F5Y09DRAFT_353648 [Xylaria sp. FL1042]